LLTSVAGAPGIRATSSFDPAAASGPLAAPAEQAVEPIEALAGGRSHASAADRWTPADNEAAQLRLVQNLATAQAETHKKAGPARRRVERQARRRGKKAPVRQHHRLGTAPVHQADAAEAELTPAERAELAAAHRWVHDWEDQAPGTFTGRVLFPSTGESEDDVLARLRQQWDEPADDTAVGDAEAAAVAKRLDAVREQWAERATRRDLGEQIAAEAEAKRLDRAHLPAPVVITGKQDETGAWVLTAEALSVADAPSATPEAAASETPANKFGGDDPSTPSKHRKPAPKLTAKRDANHVLQEGLKPHRTTDRLRDCGIKPTGADVAVMVGQSAMASYNAIRRCASIWACPVCAPKVRAVRARDLENFAAAWIARGGSKGKGGGLTLATFTVQHHKRLALDDLFAKLSKAWSKMLAYSRFRRIREETGLVGFTRAAEITLGSRNGWHPHLHVLLWWPKQMTDEKTKELEGEVYDMWHTACLAVGLAEPSRKHGVDFKNVKRGKEGAKALARYIAKVEGADGIERPMGNEMMRADLKTGAKAGTDKKGRKSESRTPFEVAKSGCEGNKSDRLYFIEYEKATHNKKMLTWSDGLKDLLQELLDVVEDSRTGEEIASEVEPGSVRVARIRRDPWYTHIVRHPGRRLALLRAYENLGLPGLRTIIESWGLTWGTDVIPEPPKPTSSTADPTPACFTCYQPLPPEHQHHGFHPTCTEPSDEPS